MREASYDRHLSEEAYVVHEILYLSFFQPIFSLYHTGPFSFNFQLSLQKLSLLGHPPRLRGFPCLCGLSLRCTYWQDEGGILRPTSFWSSCCQWRSNCSDDVDFKVVFPESHPWNRFSLLLQLISMEQAGLNSHSHSFEAKALSTRPPVDICLLFISAYVLILLVFHTWSRFSGQFCILEVDFLVNFSYSLSFPYTISGPFHSLSILSLQ